MGSNPLATWLAGLAETATAWEVAAALVGLFTIAFALWGAIDNVFDIREVRRQAVVDGPRWIVATFLLATHVWFLLSWLGYTHVATAAVYLPHRPDVDPVALSEVAVMRLGYGAFGLLALVTLRLMRVRLRRLTAAQWQPLFGEAAEYQARYHRAQARALAAEAAVLTIRSERHDALNRESRHVLRIGILERLLSQHGIAYPPRVVVDGAQSAEKES